MAEQDLRTIIIGGGWAGLAAAIHLSQAGHPVLLLESSKQLGGRTRRVSFDDHAVDVGQHLLYYSYQHTLKLFRTLNLHEPRHYTRDAFTLVNRISARRELRFRLPSLPGPWQFRLAGLLGQKMSSLERLAVVRLFGRVWQDKLFAHTDEDLPLEQTLLAQGQSEGLIRRFWAPFCQMVFHTDIRELSSRLFLQWLPRAFNPHTDNNAFLVLHQDLGRLFLDPAAEFIEHKGGSIRLGANVDHLVIEDNRVRGVWVNQELLPCRQVILAASARGNRQLMATEACLQPLVTSMERLHYQTITTVYLHFGHSCSLPHYLVHLPGPLGHWAMDKRPQGLSGVIAVQLRPGPPATQLDDDTLVRRTARELGILFPHWPALQHGLVIHTPEATLPMNPLQTSLRAEIHTPVRGLLQAGDFIRFPGPSSLESTVYSGYDCARHILEEGGSHSP